MEAAPAPAMSSEGEGGRATGSSDGVPGSVDGSDADVPSEQVLEAAAIAGARPRDRNDDGGLFLPPSTGDSTRTGIVATPTSSQESLAVGLPS